MVQLDNFTVTDHKSDTAACERREIKAQFTGASNVGSPSVGGSLSPAAIFSSVLLGVALDKF